MICMATVSVCTFNQNNNRKFIIMYLYESAVFDILASYDFYQYFCRLQQILFKETK